MNASVRDTPQRAKRRSRRELRPRLLDASRASRLFDSSAILYTLAIQHVAPIGLQRFDREPLRTRSWFERAPTGGVFRWLRGIDLDVKRGVGQAFEDFERWCRSPSSSQNFQPRLRCTQNHVHLVRLRLFPDDVQQLPCESHVGAFFDGVRLGHRR